MPKILIPVKRELFPAVNSVELKQIQKPVTCRIDGEGDSNLRQIEIDDEGGCEYLVKSGSMMRGTAKLQDLTLWVLQK